MNVPIRIRVALFVTMTFAIVIALLGTATMELYKRYSVRSLDLALQATASSVANRLAEAKAGGDTSDINEDVLETVAGFEDRIGVIRIGIFDASKRELFSDNDEDSTLGMLGVNILSCQGHDRKEQTVSTRAGEFRVASASYETTDTTQGAVIAMASLVPTNESIGRIRTIILIVAPITILLIGLGSVVIARRALRPLEKVASGIEGIRLDEPLSILEVPSSGDEIEKVARSFNSLLNRVGSLIDTQRNFLLDASHELKTPLTVIQTEIEMLLMKRELSAEERENLNYILSEVQYSSKLAIDLIYLSRLESLVVPEEKQTDVGQLLEEAARQHSLIAKGKDVKLRVKHDSDLYVKADGLLLKRAFSNVIDNAIKFSRRGGEVWVTGRLEREASRVVVTFEDRGVGLSAEDLPRVYDRFYRSRTSRSGDEKGSGLGLSIVKRIVERQNGIIRIDSQVGSGTTVTIELPTDRLPSSAPGESPLTS